MREGMHEILAVCEHLEGPANASAYAHVLRRIRESAVDGLRLLDADEEIAAAAAVSAPTPGPVTPFTTEDEERAASFLARAWRKLQGK